MRQGFRWLTLVPDRWVVSLGSPSGQRSRQINRASNSGSTDTQGSPFDTSVDLFCTLLCIHVCLGQCALSEDDVWSDVVVTVTSLLTPPSAAHPSPLHPFLYPVFLLCYISKAMHFDLHLFAHVINYSIMGIRHE